jgi:hypothetical protein
MVLPKTCERGDVTTFGFQFLPTPKAGGVCPTGAGAVGLICG